MSDPTCATCPFFGPGGRCRRFPPTVLRYADDESDEPGAVLETAVFPLTHKDNWCGEHPQRRGAPDARA